MKNKNNNIGNKMEQENFVPHPKFIGLTVLNFNGCLSTILGEISLEGLLKNGMGIIIGKTTCQGPNSLC